VIVWWVIIVAGAAALVVAAGKGPNAVWGSATIGLIVGIAVAIYQPGFQWMTVLKGLAMGAVVGALFELLPRLTGRSRR
jgi:4-hydroxybenzoate polyprenyltransferase